MIEQREIAVLGGTGKSGRRVTALLRAEGHAVRVASRSGEVRFDWADPGSWPAVTDGADALYLVAPGDPAPLRPFLDRVQDAGVRRVVLLSGRASDTWRGRFGHAMTAAEEALRDSDVSWTILGSSNFMQNFSEDLWHAPVLAGRLALPSGGVPEPFVDLDDVAEVAARLLTGDDHRGETLPLSGPAALTYDEAVAEIAAATGRSIRFEEITPDAYAAELRAAGLGDWVEELNGMFAVLRDGVGAAPAPGVEQVLGRPPRSFAEWVGKTAPSGVWGS